MILNQLPLTRLRFDLTALEPAEVPAYKGDLLRMALLWWLSEYWCLAPDRCRHGCREPQKCLFGRLCQPAVDPAWPLPVRRLMGDSPPPAYALWDRQDRRRSLAEGDAWSFEVTLAGTQALQQIPAIIAAVQEGAEQGMGRIRLRSRVQRVSAPGTGGPAAAAEACLAEQQPLNDGTALTWQSFRAEDVQIGHAEALAWAQAFERPVRSLSLRYLSPAKLKEQGQWVEVPDFRPVMRALVRRLRLLSAVHGGGEWAQAEYGPLLDLAETVRLEHEETLWAGYTRRSKSSGVQEVEGFTGQAWYAGDDLRPLLPVLWLGQWLHIGKEYVLGCGRYVIEQVAA